MARTYCKDAVYNIPQQSGNNETIVPTKTNFLDSTRDHPKDKCNYDECEKSACNREQNMTPIFREIIGWEGVW